MYLSKLELNLQNRQTVNCLTDCQKMHRMLCGLFSRERQEQQLLYRVKMDGNRVFVYLHSREAPERIPAYGSLVGQREVSDWVNTMEAGQVWGFDLLAMPSKKVYQPERDQNSRRRILRHSQERQEWLRRKGEQNGFRILQAEEQQDQHSKGYHPEEKGGVMHLDAYRYQGVLQIRDGEKFRKALAEGIGPGKAYGLGMLLLRRL